MGREKAASRRVLATAATCVIVGKAYERLLRLLRKELRLDIALSDISTTATAACRDLVITLLGGIGVLCALH